MYIVPERAFPLWARLPPTRNVPIAGFEELAVTDQFPCASAMFAGLVLAIAPQPVSANARVPNSGNNQNRESVACNMYPPDTYVLLTGCFHIGLPLSALLQAGLGWWQVL